MYIDTQGIMVLKEHSYTNNSALSESYYLLHIVHTSAILI